MKLLISELTLFVMKQVPLFVFKPIYFSAERENLSWAHIPLPHYWVCCWICDPTLSLYQSHMQLKGQGHYSWQSCSFFHGFLHFKKNVKIGFSDNNYWSFIFVSYRSSLQFQYLSRLRNIKLILKRTWAVFTMENICHFIFYSCSH